MEKENETWDVVYNDILESYVPGDTLPPVKDEWRFRYYRYFWRVDLDLRQGEKTYHYTPMRSDRKPVIKGDTVGISTDSDGGEPMWLFLKFSSCKICKFRVTVRYVLLSDDDDGVKIQFKEDEPVAVVDSEPW